MSYILDALRRAEAQRSRGAVPTLHAPALDAGPYSQGPRRPGAGPNRWAWIGILSALAAVLGVLAWRMLPRPAALPEPPPGVAIAAPARLPAGPPGAELPRMPDPVVAQTLPPTPPPALALPPPRRNDLPSGSGRPGAPVLTLRSTEPPPPLPPLVTPTAPAGTPPRDETPAVPARRADAALPSRRDLPPEVQRELPALAISGVVYSADRAQRMLMVNGELLHEGDRIGPELVLEEIRRKDAVLRYRGQRFSVAP